MAVWTISAQAGTGGLEIATELARRADVPLLDRKALLRVARSLEPGTSLEEPEELEERLGGRLNELFLSAALTTGAADAFREFQLRRTLPELGRTVLCEAARTPAVIVAPAAFAPLRDHPSAVHVRLRAPFEWRVDAYRLRQLVDRRAAEKAVRHDDEHKRTWSRTLYHVDVDDPALFSVVVDVSRFPSDRVVETLLAAAAATPLAYV
jgi:cytidylate kinase